MNATGMVIVFTVLYKLFNYIHIIIVAKSLIYNWVQWRIKRGGGADWTKTRGPHHLGDPNPKLYIFPALFLIRDRTPF